MVKSIKQLMPQLQANLPTGIQVTTLTDLTTAIEASVADVEFELMLTVGLVVLVIFLFLRSLYATIIPSVAVPLSLVGTFAAMYILGYSLDNLSLMALTISTGFVVDDAIVMIENISRYIEAGDPPMEAALKGAEQIGFTILSLTVSLIAVLIPLLVHGRRGGAAVPRVCRDPGRHHHRFGGGLPYAHAHDERANSAAQAQRRSRGASIRATERAFEGMIAFYGRTLKVVLRYQTITLLVAVATLLLTVFLYIIIPKGFFPVQDTGVIQGISQAPPTIGSQGDGRKAAGAYQGSSGGPGGGKRFVIHRRRWNEYDDQQRPDVDQLEAARPAQDQRIGPDPQAYIAREPGAGNPAVHGAGAEHHRG